MKKLLPFFAVLLFCSFIVSDNPISKKERKFVVGKLKTSEKNLQQSIRGLSEAQLKFKPSENQWSVEGCVKHIAMTEQMLSSALEEAMKQPANAEKRSAIKVSDDELMNFMENRTNKVQTADPLKPENITFANVEEAMAAFKLNREKLVRFAQDTKEDLRNHVVELPFGSYDAYQMLLLMASHSARHTQQIEEVKASAQYPR